MEADAGVDFRAVSVRGEPDKGFVHGVDGVLVAFVGDVEGAGVEFGSGGGGEFGDEVVEEGVGFGFGGEAGGEGELFMRGDGGCRRGGCGPRG